MPTALKWIIGLIVVAGAGWFLWWSGWLGNTNNIPASQTGSAVEVKNVAADPQNGMSESGNTSDAALAQDSAALDAQLKAFAQDSSNIDSSLNDKPVAQSY